MGLKRRLLNTQDTIALHSGQFNLQSFSISTIKRTQCHQQPFGQQTLQMYLEAPQDFTNSSNRKTSYYFLMRIVNQLRAKKMKSITTIAMVDLIIIRILKMIKNL